MTISLYQPRLHTSEYESVPGTKVLFMQSPQCLLNNLSRSYECHEKRAHILDLYLIHSCLLFGIIKLTVYVPRGLCLDRDFYYDIVASISLMHYLTASVPIKT